MIDDDEATIKAVVAQAPTLTEEHVRAVLQALQAVKQGAAVGTVCQDPESGAVAVRVSDNGVHVWNITGTDGAQWRDMQPTLPGWTVFKDGASA